MAAGDGGQHVSEGTAVQQAEVTMYKIYWDNDHALSDSVDSVERLLDRLHEYYRARDPTLVTVERAGNGDSLSIGLEANITVLNCVRGDQNPPYYTSSGGTDADETISFCLEGSGRSIHSSLQFRYRQDALLSNDSAKLDSCWRVWYGSRCSVAESRSA